MAPALTKKPDLNRHELCNGDHMSREEFHRAYVRMPEHVKAELIGGIVYMASPLGINHATNHLPLGTLFYLYEAATDGVQSGDNATLILGDDSEPQPDLFMRILPEYGGQSTNTENGYVKGSPELVAEIAPSSYSVDLHRKRDDYAKYGVREYLVLTLGDEKLRWFDLANQRERLIPTDGICKLRTFPGFWIHQQALLKRNPKLLMRTLKRGLASAEHAAFVKKLDVAQRKLSKRK